MYKERHSQSVLLAKYEKQSPDDIILDDDRKFALVYYWCPDRAGNVLHNLWNSVTWSIITNRTILWKYDPYWNTVEDCEVVLKRAPWIAGWEEWSKKLRLEEKDVMPVPIDVNRLQYDAHHRVVVFPQIPDLDSDNPRLYRNSWRDHPLISDSFKYYINDMSRENRIAAGMLYYEGVDYLYGMLFREIFNLQVYRTALKIQKTKPLPLSIALHSRHPVVGDDGTYVQEEIDCLANLISAYRQQRELRSSLPSKRNATTDSSSASSTLIADGGCQVYLMSDRPRTIEILSRWLIGRNCTPISVRHDNGTSGKITEHGPWAGIGFLEDLEIAASARWAVVGDFHRSSFMLLVELIEYDRMVEAWRTGDSVEEQEDGETNEVEDLRACTLREKPSSGYNYGPGTPTFRHHTFQEPMAPVRIAEQYKTMHSVESLPSEMISNPIDDGRRYLRVTYSCSDPSSTDESILSHHFLNGT